MSDNFVTRNETFRALLGNGTTYIVPPFQRDYSWEEEQWEDLWLDIVDIVNEDNPKKHYMAYLVLQKISDKDFHIIDGQQRLTTISIIILCALRYITTNLGLLNQNHINDSNRINELRRTYIDYTDAVTLKTKSKLTLNRNNDYYFQTYIVKLGDLPIRGFKHSEHLLRKASEWFDKKIADYIKCSLYSQRLI